MKQKLKIVENPTEPQKLGGEVSILLVIFITFVLPFVFYAVLYLLCL